MSPADINCPESKTDTRTSLVFTSLPHTATATLLDYFSCISLSVHDLNSTVREIQQSIHYQTNKGHLDTRDYYYI